MDVGQIAAGFAGTGYVREVHHLDEAAKRAAQKPMGRVLKGRAARSWIGAPRSVASLGHRRRGLCGANIWEVYRLTGTIHLLVISGLHVSVLSLMLFALLFFPLRMLGMHRRRDLPALAAAAVVCAGALWIGWFTGAGSPVMRVAVMLLAVFALKLTQRPSAMWYVLAASMLVTSAAMPLQVFRSGF